MYYLHCTKVSLVSLEDIAWARTGWVTVTSKVGKQMYWHPFMVKCRKDHEWTMVEIFCMFKLNTACKALYKVYQGMLPLLCIYIVWNLLFPEEAFVQMLKTAPILKNLPPPKTQNAAQCNLLYLCLPGRHCMKSTLFHLWLSNPA